MSKARDLADLAKNANDRLDTVATSDGALSSRNMIVNGDMVVHQRGPQTAAGGHYMTDRWQIAESGDFLGSTSQESDAPVGFSKSLKIETTTAFTEASFNSGYVLFRQKIETQNVGHLAYGTSDAKDITLSFWVKSSKTGTYVVELNATLASTTKNSITYTINAANTWEYKTLTFQGYTVAGDSWTSADNASGLQIYWWLAAGANWKAGTLAENTWHTSGTSNRVTGQVNWADTVGATYYITGVQLEVGSKSTEFEHILYSDQLARCQRYYHKNGAAAQQYYAKQYTSSHKFIDIQHPVQMRAAPAVSFTMSGGSWTTYLHDAVHWKAYGSSSYTDAGTYRLEGYSFDAEL